MDEPANNHAVEKRMKEALKKDRSRIQVGKMSMFGLLELSRQRMHSSFFESNYQVCPHCQGKGMVRTIESSAVYVLRGIEEEGIKGRSCRLNVFVPSDIAIYLLNHKRQNLLNLEQKYKMDVIISADDSVQCISDYRIERTKATKAADEDTKTAETVIEPENTDTIAPEVVKEEKTLEPTVEEEVKENTSAETEPQENGYRNNRHRRDGRRRGRDNRFDRKRNNNYNNRDNKPKERQEAVILYNSHEDIKPETPQKVEEQPKEKSTWWKKLIKG